MKYDIWIFWYYFSINNTLQILLFALKFYVKLTQLSIKTQGVSVVLTAGSMQLQALSLGVRAGFEQNSWAETQKGKFQVIFSQHKKNSCYLSIHFFIFDPSAWLSLCYE